MAAHLPSFLDANDPRLAALYATSLLDADPREAFDRLTRLAARLLAAPTALITLVSHDRQFFLSAEGLTGALEGSRGTPLSHSICQYTIHDRQPLVVEDARLHPLLQRSPAVEELGVVAYCGIPLFTAEGFAIGALCVVDGEPRSWSDEQVSTLADLAALCSSEIQLHAAGTARMRSEQWARRQQAILSLVAHDAPLGTILEAIARHVEADGTGALCSVLVFDEGGSVLFRTAAPASTDAAEDEVADGDPAWPLQPIDTDDIAQDPRCAAWSAAALARGFRACWTAQITAAADESVLGTFVVYSRTVGGPTATDRQLAQETSELARIAIERARTAIRLRRQELVVERARMHEALGRLAGVVAHEFNSLLTAVLGAAAELRGRTHDAAGAQDLDVIDDAARKASSLTARLLAAAGRRYLRPRPVELGGWMTTLRQSVEAELPPRIQFRIDAPACAQALIVSTDSAALGEAVLALVDNAIRAMPDGGCLTLRIAATRIGRDDAAPLTADGIPLPPGAYACIAVEDSGRGMHEPELAAALDFFGRARAPGGGADGVIGGFGLPLVAGIVRQTGGHVTARSAPAAGTAVMLWLPTDLAPTRLVVADRALGDARSAAPGPDIEPGRRGVVLLVDDEPTIRRVLQRALERVGYEVVEATDGLDAWDRFQARPDEITAVLCDWRMPRLDGRTLREQIRAQRPGLPVLIMTGYVERANTGDAEPIELLTKPFKIDELITRLDLLVAAARSVEIDADRLLA